MKLTAEQVAEIRASSGSNKALMEKYGLSRSRVWAIKQGEAYKIRNWYVANTEKARETVRNWQEANPEKAREADKRYREAHPELVREAVRASTRRWREAHIDEARKSGRKASTAWKAKNREKAQAATRAWFKAHPAEARALGAKRRANKREATVGDPEAIAAVYAKARSGEVISCAYCGKETVPGNRHVDHAIALAHEDRGPHSAENLVIARARCNLRKHTKTPDEFRALLAAEDRSAQ